MTVRQTEVNRCTTRIESQEAYNTYASAKVKTSLPTVALKPKGDVTRNLKQGHHCPHKGLCPPTIKKILKLSLTCSDVLSVPVVLGLDEVGEDVLVAPAVRPVVGPLVVIVPRAPQVLHVVKVTGASQTLTRWPHAHL